MLYKTEQVTQGILKSEKEIEHWADRVFKEINDAKEQLDTARYFVVLYRERFPHEKSLLEDAEAKFERARATIIGIERACQLKRERSE